LRVLTYNLQFGKGTDNLLNWDRTATWIANINPDIAQFCEVPPDGVSTLTNLLIQKTGRTWYSFWVPKAPGINEGNLILSKYPFISTSSLYLSYTRSVAQATISVAGRTINFFGTHLDDASSSNRYQEVGELLNFAAGFSENKIVCGDFNGGPDTAEAIRMTGSFYDSWMQGMNAGTAVSYPDNPVQWQTRTRRGRIDYAWYSMSAGNLILRGTQIPDTRDLNNKNVVEFLGTTDDYGVRPSDHNPMIANFDIR
jgi:endonuclease/exonuclease/phosphatase family metal-dependent hydrolase